VRDLEREREDPDDEPEWDPEEEEPESDPESESESEPDSEPDDGDPLLRLFADFALVDDSPSLSLARSFSFAASNLLAVPFCVLNSSGNSTEGFPISFALSKVLTFASCSVLDGRETYGRVDLHS